MERDPNRHVAVVGMACRLPGADSTDDYWNILVNNVDAITEVPQDRFDIDTFFHDTPGTPGRTNSRFGGFIDNIRQFDAQFFGISPREARSMDPQQRLLLEVAWHALEDACVPPAELAGSRTGVFVGQTNADYSHLNKEAGGYDIRSASGSELRAVTAGRLSYTLDLRGPSMVVDTACSSSLVAVHMAKQSLLIGDCDLAIAAGTNVILSPDDAIAYAQAGMLASDGRCKFGDAAADGFVRSEGVCVVILKRLPDAVADQDPVHAVLLGSAVVNDGRASGLLLQPSIEGQVETITAACADAGVDPRTVDYVEAHGTGTRVGDRTELEALHRVLGPLTAREHPCLIGSAKSNVGHTEATAGLAGLIKAVLIAEHGMVPASLHVSSLNRVLTRAEGVLRLANHNQPLPATDRAAVLGVSSFGISGTNAHVLLGAYQPDAVRADSEMHDTPTGPSILTVSARSSRALRANASAFHKYLSGGRERPSGIGEITYTAAARRDHHEHRLAVTGESPTELAEKLAAFLANGSGPDVSTGDIGARTRRPTVFLFSGQGGQWVGMGRALYASSPAFRTAIDECDAAARGEIGWSVRGALLDYPTLESVQFVQPVLWATQVALAAHWRSCGVVPDLVLGHSMGEVAAAQVAGALSTQDAAAVICRRSELMGKAAGTGSMLWVRLSAEQSAEMLAGYPAGVSVAADNSPGSSVLSGDSAVLLTVARDLELHGIACHPVDVDIASHSPQMGHASRLLREALGCIRPTAPDIPFYSTVYARRQTEPMAADYWADNLRLPVRLTESLRAILAEQDCVVVEIGPHPVLLPAVREVQREAGRPETVVGSIVRDGDELRSIANSVAQVYVAGGQVDWTRLHGDAKACVALPGYQWDREDHWHDVAPSARIVRRVDTAKLDQRGGLDASTFRGVTPLPCWAFVDAVLGVAAQMLPRGEHMLTDVRFHELVTVDPDALPTLRVTLSPQGGSGEREFAVHTMDGTLRVTGAVRPRADRVLTGRDRLDEALARYTRFVSSTEFYQHMAEFGYDFTGGCRNLRQAWRGVHGAIGRFSTTNSLAAPMLWETALQLLPLLTGGSFVPTRFDRVEPHGALSGDFWSIAELRSRSSSTGPVFDVTVVDEFGAVLAVLEGVHGHTIGVTPATSPRKPLRRLRHSIRRTPRSARTPGGPGGEIVTVPVHENPAPGTAESDSAGCAPDATSTIVAAAAAVLGTTADRIDVRKSLLDHGLDSMMATQLVARLRATSGITVSTPELMATASIHALGAEIERRPARPAGDQDAARAVELTGNRPSNNVRSVNSSSSHSVPGSFSVPTYR